MLQYFEDKPNPHIERTKSFSNPNISFIDFLQNGGNFDLAVHGAIEMYKKTTPLFNAVDIRGRNFSQIPTHVFDKKANDWVLGHPILDLLGHPNADQTTLEFMQGLANYFDITGNAFLMLTGRLTREPLEIFNVRPQDIQFGTERSNIFPTLPKEIKISTSDGDISTFNI